MEAMPPFSEDKPLDPLPRALGAGFHQFNPLDGAVLSIPRILT